MDRTSALGGSGADALAADIVADVVADVPRHRFEIESARPRLSRRQRFVASRRAAVLWTLAIVMLSQVATEVALRRWAPELQDSLLGARLKSLEVAVARADHPLVVVALGSSRIKKGFAAAHIQEPLGRALGRPVVVYNLGVDAGFSTTNEIVLRRLLASGLRPDLVLLEALASPLLDDTEHRDQALEPSRLSREELALADLRFPASATWDRWLDWSLNRAFPLYRDRTTLQRRLLAGWGKLNYPLDDPEAGWRPTPTDALTDDRRARALAVTHDTFWAALSVAHPVAGPECSALGALAELLARERIPTVLVVTPEGPAFRSWYAPGNLAGADRFIEATARANGLGLVNARTWIADEKLFEDSSHLGFEGALLFSERLEREIVRPTLVAGAR